MSLITAATLTLTASIVTGVSKKTGEAWFAVRCNESGQMSFIDRFTASALAQAGVPMTEHRGPTTAAAVAEPDEA